ncbi:MAG: GMC family oxidoreductase [Myxococcota bacterium]
MMFGLEELRYGFDVAADVVVVGSGPGGAVAALNLARAGMKTVLLEAGPKVRPEDMSAGAPSFLARYYWEGGTRLIGGDAQIPSLQGRCLGGSSVMNSAIMMRLPEFVKKAWIEEDGLSFLKDDSLEASYARIFETCRVEPTPLAAQGRRNLLFRDAMASVGMPGAPLTRAVQHCEGSADCILGCPSGRKQSVDRTYVEDAMKAGAAVYTGAMVERILLEQGRAVGVSGRVVDNQSKAGVANFTVRAPRIVLAGGAAQTPALLQFNGLTAAGTVGSSFFAHIGAGILGFFDEVVDPWVGATQGWGAVSPDIEGLKFESLWAPPSLILLRWGGLGGAFYRDLADIKHATVAGLVYRGKVKGTVRASSTGMPKMKLEVPAQEIETVLRGVRQAVDGLFNIGARGVHIGISRSKTRIDSRDEAHALLEKKYKARDIPMTANHIFGSVPMSMNRRRGSVDDRGKLRGIEGVWIADASLFPSPSAVNPQATVMALSDRVSRLLSDQALI